ncbi:hypothetical protein AB0K61_16515, partial [Streptomyces syringium]|uniref:hypothetical protein n=1 Tax=Streptomyces syringium TaxID=76729 RepID=UPI0034276634
MRELPAVRARAAPVGRPREARAPRAPVTGGREEPEVWLQQILLMREPSADNVRPSTLSTVSASS